MEVTDNLDESDLCAKVEKNLPRMNLKRRQPERKVRPRNVFLFFCF